MNRFRSLYLTIVLTFAVAHVAFGAEPPSGEPDASLPTPPPAPGGPSFSNPHYATVTLPGPNYHVVAKYYDPSCPSGNLCDQRTYAPSPGSSVVFVPVCYGGPFVFYDWAKVRIEHPAHTPAAFFDAALDFPRELFPASRPEDRNVAYTVQYDPDVVRVLNTMVRIKGVCQTHFGYSREPVEIRWSDNASYSVHDYMELPDLSQFDQYGSEVGQRMLEGTLGHEYGGHALFRPFFSGFSLCTKDVHYIWDHVFADCAPHDGCVLGQSYMGSWSEGFAAAVSVYIVRVLHNEPQGDPWPFVTCWQQYPDDPEMLGTMRGHNVASYLYHLMAGNPLATFNTFRYGRMTEVTGQTHPATTLVQYRALWTDTNNELNRWISAHHPGTFNSDAAFEYFVHGVPMPVTAVESPPYPNVPEDVKLNWIRSISPNPVRDRSSVRLRALVPSSGEVEISVYSVTGRRVVTQGFPNLPDGETEFSLTLPRLASGVYLLHYVDALRHRVEDSAKIIVLK